MTVGMEFKICRDRLSDLTTSEINCTPRLQLSAKKVSPIIGTPPTRGPFSFKERRQTGADDQGCDHHTNRNAIVKPSELVLAAVK